MKITLLRRDVLSRFGAIQERAMAADIRLVSCLSDNYAVIVRDPSSGATAVIDAPDATPIERALENAGWKLTHILITHHHGDHVQGIAALKKRFGALVIGPRAEADKIPMLDQPVGENGRISVGGLAAQVIDTPGHTAGHISYWLEAERLLFAGDTLFALGCGRPFERPAPVLWESLQKLRKLPGDTRLYCGHEYTLANARFAVTVDPTNVALKARLTAVEAQHKKNEPTLPSTIKDEQATNPFLRADDPAVAEAIGMKGADPAAVFTELRERKNNFKG
jgi:hydroxyacylglutathione hydrolase